jgi:hypothetical protein
VKHLIGPCQVNLHGRAASGSCLRVATVVQAKPGVNGGARGIQGGPVWRQRQASAALPMRQSRNMSHGFKLTFLSDLSDWCGPRRPSCDLACLLHSRESRDTPDIYCSNLYCRLTVFWSSRPCASVYALRSWTLHWRRFSCLTGLCPCSSWRSSKRRHHGAHAQQGQS